MDMELVLRLLMPANAAAIRVSLATGIRIGDVLSLTVAQVAAGPNVRIAEQKTGRKRTVRFSPQLRQTLLTAEGTSRWTATSCAACPGPYVFPGRVDATKHRTRQAVWKDVKRAAKAARLGKGVSPHTARKVFAVELLRKYGDIEKVRDALSHRDVITTMIYAMADQLTVARK